MKIIRHRLLQDGDTPFPFERSPNIGGKVQHEYLVIHYTAGSSAEGAVSWLKNERSRASAHLVIARDGRITQLVPFDRVAWHAGMSSWEGRSSLNPYSLGIELANAGRLDKAKTHWRAWFGKEYEDDEVMEATHKHGGKSFGWHLYTPEQIEAAVEVGTLLVNKYELLDVVGHDDISPKRKSDPGPAFPMENYRSRLMGRKKEKYIVHEVARSVYIRESNGTQYPTIIETVLPPGTKVEVLESKGMWRLVDVVDEVAGLMDLQGWVHSRHLKRCEIS